MNRLRVWLIRRLGGEVPKPAPKITCLKKAWGNQGVSMTAYPPPTTLMSNTFLYCSCPDCKGNS